MKWLKSNVVSEIGKSLFSILLAILIGTLLILLIGESPIAAYAALIEGALGNTKAIANTLSKSIPLAFTGLAVAMASRCGMLNIGAEGQLHMGAMAAALCALAFSWLPSMLLIPLCIISGMIAGGVVGFIPGYFKAKKGTSEVIVAIMLNYIVTLFTAYLVNGPFKAEGSVAQTNQMPEAARLSRLVPNTQLTTALVILILTATVLYVFLWKTPLGYKIRAVGVNPSAAQTAGISPQRMMLLAMSFAGAIAALAGVTEVMGKYFRYIEGFSPSFGFTGIAVAILGRNHPFGVIVTSLLFGILDTGALRMSRVTNISANMVVVIQSLVILFVAAPEIIKYIAPRRKEEQK